MSAYIKVKYTNGINGIYRNSETNPKFGGMNCNVLICQFELVGFEIEDQKYDLDGEKVDGRKFKKMGEIESTRGMLMHPAIRAVLAGDDAVPTKPPMSLERQAAKKLGLEIPQENASA